jgi:uncharacterized membrane protein YdbT with pleckstrin-like domain
MADLVLHPTRKLIGAAYIAIAALTLAAVLIDWMLNRPVPLWLPAGLILLELWPLARHLRCFTTTLTVGAEHLRYETGLLTKSTRTLHLAKIQDVRVDQTIPQRLMNVGRIAIETAGETSRLVVEDLDRPQEIADEILRRSQAGMIPPHRAW